MKKGILWLVILMAGIEAPAQLARYIVEFTDKGSNQHTLSNPAAYLSAEALERRKKYNIALDSADLPVTATYIQSVRQAGAVTLLNASKWLNSVSIQTLDAEALQKIRQLRFVKSVTPVATFQQLLFMPKANRVQKMGMQSLQKTFENPFNYGDAAEQIKIHNGDFLHRLGLHGQGMRIGMIDAGFYQHTSLRAFDSMNRNGQVLDTWDFVARHTSVAEDHPHGMQCLSIIGANIPGQMVGSAPKASFYLYRSEDAATEFPIEEHNWVCAAERVDSAGGQIISSSLGYATFDEPSLNHSYNDMNGNTTMAAIGADLAAKKGLLVVLAAGNEGEGTWKYIMTPADADSVLAVGAVNTQGLVAPFSSYGPAADGQVKPDVVSVGWGTTVQHTNNTIGRGNGTSFATPNLAGLVTCLWQAFPEADNMRMIDVLRRSSFQLHGAPYNRVGYGLTDMKKAFVLLLQDVATATALAQNCGATLSWSSRDAAGMRYEIERKRSGDADFKTLSQLVATTPAFGQRNYQFSDALTDQPPGNVQYRIRQIVDTSAAGFTAFYIDTVSITLQMACNNTAESVLLFPNPATGRIMLQVNGEDSSQNLRIQITDALGRLVYDKRETKPAFIAVYPVDVHHLPRGTYFMSVYDGQKRLATETFIRR